MKDHDIDLTAVGEYLTRVLGAGSPMTVASLRRTAGGWSDDVYLVSCRSAGAKSMDVVIRANREEGAFRGGIDIAEHRRILECLSALNVPTPAILGFDTSKELFGGEFFVMDRLPGVTPISWSPDGREFLEAGRKGDAGRDFVRTLARIHAADVASLGLREAFVPDKRSGGSGGEVSRLEAVYDGLTSIPPNPIVRDALYWLRENCPSPAQEVLVHGDYRPANVLFQRGVVVGVLDWELAHLGDRHFDLAWTMSLFNRTVTGTVGDLVDADDFVAWYEHYSGTTVDEQALHYFSVLVHVRQLIIFLSASDVYRDGGQADLRMLRGETTVPLLENLVVNALVEAVDGRTAVLR